MEPVLKQSVVESGAIEALLELFRSHQYEERVARLLEVLLKCKDQGIKSYKICHLAAITIPFGSTNSSFASTVVGDLGSW